MIRRFIAALAALSLSVLAATGASAMAPSIVVEVNSGKVLMADDATVPWYPASVTKLMTVYVTLRQLQAGAIGRDTPIPVSRRAASVPPSKIGVRPGQEVTLDNAMKMLLVKSANDMAVVIAEGVGGTVENFADMMNREAQRIGMRESHFVNPNGLFVEGQQTSARDMALLARTILLEFPEYAGYFQIGALQLGKRVLKNTNGLIGRYPGIEGMKTGFICASGFNLVAVASRNGQRLIAVVFGASSNAERTLRAAEMLDRGFAHWGSGVGTLDSLAPSAITSPPDMREDICVHHKGGTPSEEEADAAPTSSVPGGGSDDGKLVIGGTSAAMAVASSIKVPGTRTLGPRAEFDPIPVSIGRTPGSATAPVAANAIAGGKTTATAYAGAGKSSDPNAGSDDAAAEDAALKVKPQATQLPLARGAKAVKAAPASTRTANVETKATPAKAQAAKGHAGKPAGKTAVSPSKKPATAAKAAAKVAPATTKGGKAKVQASSKIAPGAKAKPSAKAKPAAADSPAAEE